MNNDDKNNSIKVNGHIKDHGHRKDHGHNDKDNKKEDTQPPRVRRTNQASPPEYIFMFSPKHPTTLNIVREQKSQIKSNRVRKKAETGRVG